ncbi:DUF4142 domain-containing protein [Pontibacter sp. H249]|uniref:DUF4142 domain-containing protein n=1 Tax=Pontibacter sp. H249 TaxID=3133420 RepID=UPI0030C24123
MFTDKLFALAVGILFLFILSCDGPISNEAENTVALTTQKTLKNSPAFWDYAASSNMLQVEMGQLAIERGDENLKNMAEKAIGFHSASLNKLKSIARKHTGIYLPDSLSGADKGLVDEFELLEGEEFDARYRAFILNSHQLQLSRYQEALPQADDEETKAWINSILTHLQQELNSFEQADSLQK